MPVVFGLVGLAIGAAAGGVWGALALCILGAWFGIWARKQNQPERLPPGVELGAARAAEPHEIAALRRELGALERRVAGLEARVSGAPESIVSPALAPEEPVPAGPPAAEPVAATVPEPVPAAPRETVASPESEIPPSEPSRLWRWLFGGNALVRVGVVVLFFGVAFLVRFAAEHVHVPIEARLSGLALGAVVMLVLGWRLRERPGGYGLVLQGGGVGVLYLVVFGAFRIWKLVPPEAAFVLLVAVAFASAALAVAQDSRALAIAGVSGGFLAPLLASTGQGSHVALFGFYLVLDLGVLAVAWYKAWRSLNVIGFAFTFVIGAMWGRSYYQPEYYATTQPFLVAFFLLYVTIAVLYALRRAPRLNDYVDSVLVFGTPVVAAGLQAGLVKEIEYGAAWSAIALGAFYCALAWRLWGRHRETLRLLVECFIALGVAFATLAIPLAFDGRWTAASWALEGAAALWVGTRQNRWLPRVFGLLLQPAAGVAFLAAPGAAATMPVLNSHFAGAITVSLAGLFCAWYIERRRDPALPEALPAVLLAWGLAWWLGAGWTELERFAPQKSMVRGLQLLYAAASAVLLVIARRRLAWAMAGYGAAALLPLMVVFGVLWVGANAHPFAGYGYAAWPAAFLAAYWTLAQAESDLPSKLADACHCLALWLLAALAGWEFAWQLDQLVGEGRIWAQIGRPLAPALIAAWIATRTEASRWPIGPRLLVYLAVALAPIMGALWLWVLYINFASPGNPAPLPYVPLLNPLDVAVMLLGVIFLLWRRALARIAMPQPLDDVLRWAPAWGGATAFVWANGVLLRSLHHWADVPFRLEAMLRSTLVQAAFSVFWASLSLAAMVYAHRHRLRTLWACGAALLGVVVVKLFVLDLSKIGGMERIVSFIGVGVLLLLIGYLAPVPPRKEEKAP
jgi:uncharacterized membrane protein